MPEYTLNTFLDTVFKHTPDDTYIGITRINQQVNNLFFPVTDKTRLIHAIDTFTPVANVYIRITPLCDKPLKGRGNENYSVGTSVLYIDYDCYDDPISGMLKLKQLPQPPTMIVNSGNGLQAYWLLDQFETDLKAIKAKNKALADLVQADSCFDLARVLRVPYTYNRKQDPHKLAKIVDYQPNLIYKFADFKETPTEQPAIEVWEPRELQSSWLDKLQELDKKLFLRLTAGKDAPTKANGQIDRSRNDAYCVMRLLGLGYTPEDCIAVLMHPDLTTGLKYNATKRYDYVVLTVNALLKQFKASPEQYFIKGKFQATSLADQLQNKTHQFIYTAGELWRYQKGYYSRDAEHYVKQLVVDKLGDRWSTHLEGEVLGYLQSANYVPIDQCNVNSDKLINVANGMLNLETLEITPHKPDYLSLYQLPAQFDPKADTTEVDRFVAQILSNDAIPFFWEYLGSVLNVKQYWPKAFMLLIGLGDSGKSTMLRYIRSILGSHNCSSVTLQSLADNRFTVVKLYARLANIFADLDELEAGNVGQIKAITGDDVMYGEEKFKAGFDFKPTARLIFSANHYPAIKNADEAYFNRAKLIRCPNVFKGRDQRPDIDAMLTQPANLSAGLLRMVQGLQRLRTQGNFTPAESMQQELANYWLYADSVQGFLEQCHYSESYQTPRETLYAAYREFCKSVGKIPVNGNSFWRRLGENKEKYNISDSRPVRDGERVWCYDGIKPPSTQITLTLSKSLNIVRNEN